MAWKGEAMNLRLLPTLVAVTFCACTAIGQTVSWRGWVPVPRSQCCAPPTDAAACCTTMALVCERRDSLPIMTPGAPGRILSVNSKCTNCPSCCPANCHQNAPSVTCRSVLTASFTQSFSVALAPKIGGELGETIKLELGITLGWTWTTTLTAQGECQISSLQRCSRAVLDVVRNANARILHEWRLSGSWGNANCCCVCPIIPGRFVKGCGEEVSSAKMDLAVADDCEVLCTDKCHGDCDVYY